MKPHAAVPLLGLLLLAALRAQDDAARIHADAVDALVTARLARAGIGISIAIVDHGELVLAKAYGRRALDPDAPVTTDTPFAIGSVTKQFTCACVLLLAEDGKLSVHDPVARWFPDLGHAGEISLLDLMNHVSGYPDYYPLDFVDARMRTPIEPGELLRRYATERLDFAPGTEWSYSNTGYVLLGRVVEEASGEEFGAFLKRRILAPLGMAHTSYEPDPATPSFARGHTSFALGPPEPCTPEARGWIAAAGAIWSTPSDLARWDMALMAGRVLEPASLALMTTARTLRDGRSAGYGCGLAIGQRSGRAVWAHDGAVDGFVASNAMVPSLHAAVVVLANHGDGTGSLADDLLALLLERATHVPVVHGPLVAEVVGALFAGLQAGAVDRARLTPDFDEYLSEARVAGAAERLRPLGAPRGIQVLRVRERGGMEVSSCRLTFDAGVLHATMYRHPDGRIAQFSVSRD